jgi:hypothetical protein
MGGVSVGVGDDLGGHLMELDVAVLGDPGEIGESARSVDDPSSPWGLSACTGSDPTSISSALPINGTLNVPKSSPANSSGHDRS